MRRSSAKRCAAICGGLLLIFAIVSWLSFQHESATIDEPMHAMGAWYHVFDHDYRTNPEDPPLWNYLAMLPHYRGELRDPTPPALKRAALDDITHDFRISVSALYNTAGNDGAGFINLSRTAMLLAGVALGIVLSTWAYRLAGTAAAIAACVLYCFDPTVLAHSPLIKNDISLSLVLLAATWAVCSLGRRVTVLNLVLVVLIVSIGPVVKFSGVLVTVTALTLIWLRALLPWPWRVFRTKLRTIGRRLILAATLSFSIGVSSYATIWACYAFRFEPTPEPGLLLNTQLPLFQLQINTFRLAHNDQTPTRAQAEAVPMPWPGRLEQFAEKHHLLPQAWLFGMLFTYRSALVRYSYIFDTLYVNGRWYYFPCALLFKSPIATILAMLGAAGSLLLRRRWPRLNLRGMTTRWPLICIGIALAIYGISAMRTNLNIGIRHLLPAFPLIFLLIALRFRSLLEIFPRAAMTVGVLLAIGLIGETLSAFPHYISFFNLPSRSHRLALLSDSNLDWGQDLPYVADWQQQHPTVPLYLCYWCAADPAFYGIRYHNLPGGYVLRGEPEWPPVEPHAAIAVCATILQGVNCAPEFRPIYAELRKHQPSAILGDSIYLFDWPLK